MAREKVWTNEKLEKEVMPLIDKQWSVAEIARSKGLSRQRLSKILKDSGLLLEPGNG